MSTKRKMDIKKDNEDGLKKPRKEICPHGSRCYRQNPHHFKEYDHPHINDFLKLGDKLVIPDDLPQPKKVYLDQIAIVKGLNRVVANSVPSTSSAATSKNVNAKPGTMLEKLQKNGPYNYFFTTIPKSTDTVNKVNTITFTDLLCPSLGKLKCSLQINFMIDIGWLMEQYNKVGQAKKPLTILYGDEFPDMETFMDRFCPNITYKFVKMKDPFGCHHSKIGMYVYEDDSVRVVVSTANLYLEDWNYYNQGLWISPACPRLPDSSSATDGESVTGFKNSLLNYLKHYNFDILNQWIEIVQKTDFSAIKVFLVTSVPGRHNSKSSDCHLTRIGDLLSRHCVLPVKSDNDAGPLEWTVIAQASSLGSMGKSPAEWLRGALLRSLSSHSKCQLSSNSSASFRIVYPSVDNVMTGYFGAESGGCLPYSKATNEKQRWLQDQWKADGLTRTRAMPHIKTYCRVSPCLTKLGYFLLTSANISKSAWGGNIQKNGTVYVRSYEAGVLFLPKFFDESYFEIKRTLKGENKNLFPFMYDLPLVPYKADDYPWCN